MYKKYCVLLILAMSLIMACKGDKKEKAEPAKVENAASSEKAPKQNDVQQEAKKTKSDKTKGRKGYWTGLAEAANFTDDQLSKLKEIEKERRKKLSQAQDDEKPGINKEYTKKKKDLLGHKLFRAYREFDKKWKSRNK